MNIGCDIEEVETFRKKWKRKETNFFQRIFSENEIIYCKKFKDPSPHFAARFCAKEAMVKAGSPFCKILVTDVEIINQKNGAPTVKMRKKRKELEKFFSKYEIFVSLSHTSDMAMACIVVQKKNT